MRVEIRTNQTHPVTQRIFTPLNFEDLLKIQCGKSSIKNQPAVTHLLKYVLHCCYTARFVRGDWAPISFHAAAAICKGDRNKFSKLRKALLGSDVLRCDQECRYREKAFYYSLGSAMEGVGWKLSAQEETFSLLCPLNPVSTSDIGLSVDHSILDQAIARVKAARNWDYETAVFWRWRMIGDLNGNSSMASTGRLYGTWSSIPRELRGSFLIKGERVVEVDIKTAQPMLLIKLYKSREATECRKFIKLIVSGKFYEAIMKVSGVPDREEIKHLVMAFLCGKMKSTPHIPQFFEDYFPELLAEIHLLRKGTHHKKLAQMLQNFESDIIVQNICQRFPVLSMHDGVIAPASMAEEVRAATEKAVTDYCGIKAIVKIEDKRVFLECVRGDEEGFAQKAA